MVQGRFRFRRRGFVRGRRAPRNLMWINTQALTDALTADTAEQVDLLANAAEFQRFNARIEAVQINQLGVTLASASGSGRTTYAAYLRVGSLLLDVADQADPLSGFDGSDISYLWTSQRTSRETGGSNHELFLVGNKSDSSTVTVRTRRRLRQGSDTLWLVHEFTTGLTTPSDANASYQIRVLVRLP